MLLDQQLYALYRNVYRQFARRRADDEAARLVLTSALPSAARAVAHFAELDARDATPMRTYEEFQAALAQGEGALAGVGTSTPADPGSPRRVR
jgi:hypothetical protein